MFEPTVLLVDDEPEVLNLLDHTLRDHHFTCLRAPNLLEAKTRVETCELGLVVTDVALTDGSGLDLLKYIRCSRPSLPVIVITGFPSINVAEEALRLGAFDLIEKPFNLGELVEIVSEAAASRQRQVGGLREMLLLLGRAAVFINRDGRVLAANAMWEQLVGSDGHDAGRPFNDYVAANSSIDINDLLLGLDGADVAKAEVALRSPHGAIKSELSAVPFRERREQPGGFLITVEPAEPEPVEKLSAGSDVNTDPLTGFLSQRGFFEALDKMRREALRHSLPVSIMMIDIDHLQQVNQSQGYEAGDRVLRNLAGEISQVVRQTDLVGRFGSDEFIVAVYEATAAEGLAVANRLVGRLAATARNGTTAGPAVSVTIGVTDCPAGYTSGNQKLAEQAALAVLWGRDHQAGPTVRYNQEMDAAGAALAVNNSEIERLTREFAAVNESLKSAYVDSARALVAAVEAKDPYTRKHSELVACYAEQLAREMNLPESLRHSIRCAAALHDVGKIGIADCVLTKPGALTAEEYELIKQHPIIGANIVSHVSCMRREVPFIQHHHENWDGTGYPAGLSGSTIPIGARVLRVADSFDAILSQRSYKERRPLASAMSAIIAGRGTLYDPAVVAALEALHRKEIVQKLLEEEEG